jgi:hypothetical protein
VISKLPKLISDGLDSLAEDGNSGVPLHNGAKLRVQRVDAGVTVILKKLLERGPELGSGGTIVGDEVEELGGDAGVDPLDDGEIVGDPAWVGGLGNRGCLNVVTETATTKVDVEEVAPMIVVVGTEVEDDGDKRGDIGDCIGERDRHGWWW